MGCLAYLKKRDEIYRAKHGLPEEPRGFQIIRKKLRIFIYISLILFLGCVMPPYIYSMYMYLDWCAVLLVSIYLFWYFSLHISLLIVALAIGEFDCRSMKYNANEWTKLTILWIASYLIAIIKSAFFPKSSQSVSTTEYVFAGVLGGTAIIYMGFLYIIRKLVAEVDKLDAASEITAAGITITVTLDEDDKNAKDKREVDGIM